MPFLHDACLNDRYGIDAPTAVEFQVSRLSDDAGHQLAARNSPGPSSQHQWKVQQMTPEFHGNQYSIEPNLIGGSGKAWIHCLLFERPKHRHRLAHREHDGSL
jgi:hypothetical protein